MDPKFPVVVWFGRPGTNSPWYMRLWASRLGGAFYTHVSVQIGGSLYDVTKAGGDIILDVNEAAKLNPHRFAVGLHVGFTDLSGIRDMAFLVGRAPPVSLWRCVRSWLSKLVRPHSLGQDCMTPFLSWWRVSVVRPFGSPPSYQMIPPSIKTPDELFRLVNLSKPLWVGSTGRQELSGDSKRETTS